MTTKKNIFDIGAGLNLFKSGIDLGTNTKFSGQSKSYDVSTTNTTFTIKEEGRDLDNVIEIIICKWKLVDTCIEL